jgi:SAM-dependent methyltransferase
MFRKLKSVILKNLARFRARRAVRRGLFDGIDWKVLTEIRGKFDGHRCRKYYDRREHSFIRNAERIFALGLDKSSGLRILDLGCGFGYFMYAAGKFGHQTIGVDIDDPFLNEVTPVLGLKKVIHTIVAYQPLPEIPGGPFDLITAFATMFDFAGVDGQWGVAEWQYFLKDLTRYMAPGCLLNLKFNQYVGEGTRSGIGCRPVPDPLWAYFHSIGGKFDKRTVQIHNAPAALASSPRVLEAGGK